MLNLIRSAAARRASCRIRAAICEVLENRQMLSAPVLEPPIARELRSDYVSTGGYINFEDPNLAVSRYEWEYSGQRLVYQFDQNTSVTRDDVILTRLNNGAQLVVGDLIDSTTGYTETQVFDFPINPTFGYRTLPNGNYEAILRANGPSNNDGQKLASENVTDFFVLMGDINHDRVVDANDYAPSSTSTPCSRNPAATSLAT